MFVVVDSCPMVARATGECQSLPRDSHGLALTVPAQARAPPRRPIRRHQSTSSASPSPTDTGSAGTAADGATLEPPPAGGHLPSVATSRLMRTTREAALRTPGLRWTDPDEPGAHEREIVSGRETRKMNLYQAVRDAMRSVLTRLVLSVPLILLAVMRC